MMESSRKVPILTRFALMVCAMLTTMSVLAAVEKGQVYDVLDLPAMPSPLAAKTWLHAVTRAGDRIIAVGQRGHIVYSDDGGDSWTQAEVPVRSMLTCVDFPTPDRGWAAGHDGVILHSTDGGQSWTKQLDGYEFNQLALDHYRMLATENPENELYTILMEEAEFSFEQGADRPWLVIHYNEFGEGYAAGAYGLVAVTYDDGDTWIPVIEAVENHDGFNHIYGFERLPNGKHIVVGERGSVWNQPDSRAPFELISPFYTGSFYTAISSRDGAIIVSGMRGTTFRSTDEGSTWQRVQLPVSESIISSERLMDGRIVLVSSAGSILLSADDGMTFRKLDAGPGGPLTDVIEVEPGVILVTGRRGVSKVDLNQPPSNNATSG
jgi:photosystem II stability/assembly factor-like uncharacterized protein